MSKIEHKSICFSNYNLRENTGLQLTCRLGEKWAYYKGEWSATNLDGSLFDNIKVVDVWLLPFYAIPESILFYEHDPKCRSIKGLSEEMARVYSDDFSENSKVTLLFFTLVTPEQRFLELIDGMTIRIDKDKYPDSVFFFKGDEWMVEIENLNVWFRNSGFWNVFENEFSMQYDAIESFLKDMLEKHFKIKGLTPYNVAMSGKIWLEKHFKIKGLTPQQSVLL